MLTWAEIYPTITSYPPVLQALLAPATTTEAYYRELLAAARGVGLTDSRVLLGLLWHAPMGEGSQQPNRWEYLVRLVGQNGAGEMEMIPERRYPGRKGLPPGPVGPEAGSSSTSGDRVPGTGVPGTAPAAAGPPDRVELRGQEGRQPGGNGGVHLQEEEGEMYDAWADLFRLSRDHLVVDRRRYEAMIYELGKLGAWQEFGKQQHRDNRRLREKIEAQWIRELDYFRQLSFKGDKRGWRKW